MSQILNLSPINVNKATFMAGNTAEYNNNYKKLVFTFDYSHETAFLRHADYL